MRSRWSPRKSLKALQDGQARLVLLAPHPEEVDVGLEGTVLIPMTCQSEGTLAIYLEPFLPRRDLVVVGQSPTARSLAALGGSLGFRVCACDPSATEELFPTAETLVQELQAIRGTIGPRSYVVVATMGHYDEEALEAALSGQASYVGLVASPRRGRAVIDYLRAKGVSSEALAAVKYPAGLDIGAATPEEVALSILTEIVQRMRAAGEGVSLEPAVQAGEVEAIDPHLQHDGQCGRRPVSVQPQRYDLLLLLPELQAKVRAGTPTATPRSLPRKRLRPGRTVRPTPRREWPRPSRRGYGTRYPGRWATGCGQGRHH